MLWKIYLFEFLLCCQLFYSFEDIDHSILTLATCSNRQNISIHSACHAKQCMSIWSEEMPYTWIDTTKYSYPEQNRIGPTWNIFNDIYCVVQTKIKSNSIPVVCFCHLPAMSYKSLYADYSLTHSLFYGDSTLRNFYTFMKGDLNRAGYATLIRDPQFRSAYLQTHALLNSPLPHLKLANFTSSLLEYNLELKKLPRSSPFWGELNPTHSQCLNISTFSDSILTYHQDAYEDLDQSHVPYYYDAVRYCNNNPDRLLIFIISGGLHYLTRNEAPAHRNRMYESHIFTAFYHLIEGVYSSESPEDCPSRSVFLWKVPNLIDDHFVGSSGHGESYFKCLEEALDPEIYDSEQLNPMDIATLQYLCRDSAFSRRGSENIAARSKRVIDVMNICLQTNLSDEIFYNQTLNWGRGRERGSERRSLSTDLGVPFEILCPKSMKGLFSKNSNHHSAIPSKILSFPGDELSYFLSQAKFPNDGRHYGLGMYLPFKRSLQGIAHEYAKATADKRSSVMALFDHSDEKIRDRAEVMWKERLQLCYDELNLPEDLRNNNINKFL